MPWFSYARNEGYPTQYPPNHTPVTVDVLEAGFVTAFVLLAFCFFVALPSLRWKNNLYLFVRISLSLLIGLFILLANFGQEWEVGHIHTKTAYRAGIGAQINASVALKIGLRGINVTLKSNPHEDSALAKEEINYNERFEWVWDQGRFGFGPEAGLLQREFRAAQYRGAPLPILWVVDHFVIDGEGFRFGRFYRTAGWYTHIALWTAFPCWLLSLILFRSVIRYGAYFLGIAGALLLLGNILWASIRNPNSLVIPFEDANIIVLYGFSFWLCLFTGLLCVILSAVIVFLEANFDTAVSIFFGIDPLRSLDEFILTRKELELLRDKSGVNKDIIGLTELQPHPSTSGAVPEEPETTQTVYIKRRTTMRIVGAKPTIRKFFRRPKKMSNRCMEI